MNSYGFAAGDPVTYSDPYGLCPGYGANNVNFRKIFAAANLYLTQDDAARAAMTRAHSLSVNRSLERPFGIEYGGEIIKVVDSYTFTGPRTDGAEDVFTPDVNVSGFAGDYHSHGATSLGRYDDENFSPGDITGIQGTGEPGYLVTPSEG